MANDIADLLLKIDATTEGLRREIKRAESSVEGGRKQIQASTKKIDKSFTSMGDTVKKVAGVIVAAMGAMQVGRKFADVVTETEKLRGALTTITGSAEGAAMAFDKLTQFASQTPFTLDKSVNAFIKLKALGLDPSERALLSYGNTASAMGKDMMQMIEAVADASTMEFERLKEFGIKARQQADTVSFTFQGVTTTVAKNSHEIQEYLLEIGETQFAGAMEDQMSRLPGLLSNLQDNVDGLFRRIGDTGGIALFGSAIAAASGAIVHLTDNIEFILSAFSYLGAALTGPLVIGAIGMTIKAVLALNAALLANPILLVAAAFSTAAFAIYKNWDAITLAGQRASLAIQIAWNELKLFLLESFSPALTHIRDGFNDIRYQAIATWNGIAAAVANPMNALDAFNEAFNSTIEMFDDGESGVNVFGAAIDNAKGEIVNLRDRLAGTKSTIVSADGAVNVITGSLSDFKTEVDESADGTSNLNDKTKELIIDLRQQQVALSLGAREQAVYTAVMKLGTDATSEQIVEVARLTGEIYDQQKAIGFWAAAAKNGASQRTKAEADATRAMEENWQRTHEFVTTSILDIVDQGGSAWDQIADSFSAMIKRMIAEWAASGIMGMISGKGFSGFNTATGIGQLFAEGGTSSLLGMGGGAAAGGVGSLLGGSTAVQTSASWATGAPVATSSGGLMSSAGAWVAANPVLAGLAATVALAAVLDKKSTPSTNAGILVGPTPGADPSRTFALDPFESGFQAQGFARREDRSAAMEIANAFAVLDEELTTAVRAAGGNIDMSGATLSGFSETGRGDGTFLGMASEKGKGITSIPIEDQLALFAQDLFRHVEGLDEELLNAVKSASSAEEAVALLAEATADQDELAEKQLNNFEKIQKSAAESVVAAFESGMTELDAVDRAYKSFQQFADRGLTSDAIANFTGFMQSEIDAVLSAGEARAAAIGVQSAPSGPAAPYGGFSLFGSGEERRALLGIDGSHRDGLDRVPFDGYRAELHRGERVLTASEARKDDASASRADQLMMQMALYTKRMSEILSDWDGVGLPAERVTPA
jgi:hypothetical protein